MKIVETDNGDNLGLIDLYRLTEKCEFFEDEYGGFLHSWKRRFDIFKTNLPEYSQTVYFTGKPLVYAYLILTQQGYRNWFSEMWVHPKFRRQGIGEELLRNVLLKPNGVGSIHFDQLTVDTACLVEKMINNDVLAWVVDYQQKQTGSYSRDDQNRAFYDKVINKIKRPLLLNPDDIRLEISRGNSRLNILQTMYQFWDDEIVPPKTKGLSFLEILPERN